VTLQMPISVRMVGARPIRVAENVSTASQRLVLTSPWPESIFAFERVWPLLSAVAHLVAVDLPGNGGSTRDHGLLTPEAMGDFIVDILDEFGIRHAHLVCSDVGAAAGLHAAAKHPGRIRSMVVASGVVAWPLLVSGALSDLMTASSVHALADPDPLDLIQRLVKVNITDAESPSVDAIEDYLESNAGGRFAETTRYLRDYPAQLARLADLLPTIFTPVKIIGGRTDPLVPLGNAEYLHSRLPNSQLDLIDTGHFMWEQAADQYARLIAEWVNGGYLAPLGRTEH